MDRSNGMLYAPVGKAQPVCKPGEFILPLCRWSMDIYTVCVTD